MARPLTELLADTALSYTYRLRVWSIAVRKRDKVCVICGSTDQRQAHHINDKSYHPEEALDLNNGVTLCNSTKRGGNACHRMFHIYYRGSYRMKTTKKQFDQFVKIAKQFLSYVP